MKKIIILLILLVSTLLFSQETETDSLKNNKSATYEVIEHVPVYKGCDEFLSNEALKKCMATSISKHVGKHFNTKIVNGLGIPDGPVRINLVFKINKEGKIEDARARAPHPVLEEEAIRVIKLIPQLDKPGYVRGNPVTVPYALPIIFNIKNPKKTAKPKK